MATQSTFAMRLMNYTCLWDRSLFLSASSYVLHPLFSSISMCGNGAKARLFGTQCGRTRILPFLSMCQETCQKLGQNKLALRSFSSTPQTVKFTSKLARSPFVNTAQCLRNFSATTQAGSQFGVGGSGHGETANKKNYSAKGDMGLKLSNENGYLSWCRNTYLTTVVAIAMMGEGTTSFAQQAAEGVFFISGMNLTWGTVLFVHNILTMRRAFGMSPLGSLAHISFSLIHLALWFMVCTLYIGYTDEPDVKVMEEVKKPRKKDDI